MVNRARISSRGESVLQFLQTTYEAAANTARWDRAALEAQLENVASATTRRG